MDSKKKKKIVVSSIISVVIIAIIVVGSLVAYHFLRPNATTDLPSVEQTGTITQTNTYNEDIATKKIPTDYEGLFKFVSVRNIVFNTSDQKQIEQFCRSKTSSSDIQSLINYYDKERARLRDNQGERLFFLGGQFTRTLNNNPLSTGSEDGLYYGNADLAMVITSDGREFFISKNYADIQNTISVANTQNKDLTKIYVMERVYGESNKKQVLYTVTYIYELMQEDVKTNA